MRRDVFQAIADPHRRTILDLLARHPLTLNGITEYFTISRPAISKHVKILTECGLIKIRKYGRERYCEIQPQKLEEVSDWLDQYRQTWEQRFERLDTLLEELQQQEKTE
jgi:DNA-binding transcriptional ArsR family regulator